MHSSCSASTTSRRSRMYGASQKGLSNAVPSSLYSVYFSFVSIAWHQTDHPRRHRIHFFAVRADNWGRSGTNPVVDAIPSRLLVQRAGRSIKDPHSAKRIRFPHERAYRRVTFSSHYITDGRPEKIRIATGMPSHTRSWPCCTVHANLKSHTMVK